MNDPRQLHTEEKQEGETFFDVMNRLIARSKAVTADMEAVLAELESTCEFSCHSKNNQQTATIFWKAEVIYYKYVGGAWECLEQL